MKKQLLVALIGVTMSTSLLASSAKLRLTGGLGYGFNNDSSLTDIENSLSDKGYSVSVSDLENSGLGYSFWLGWEANKNVLLEVGYLDFADRSAKAANVDANFAKEFVNSLPTSGQGFAAAVHPMYEFSDAWTVYGRVGAMHWNSDMEVQGYSSSKSGTDLLIGGGLEYQVSESWLASLGWDSVKMDDTQNHLISLNMTYQFGEKTKREE